MGDVTTIGESVDFAEILTPAEVGKLFHRSDETVRQLADRERHPLPYINTGMGKKKQRLFRRSSILKWLVEEESGAHIQPVAQAGSNGAAKPPTTGRSPTKAPVPAVAPPPKTRTAAGNRA